jgi:hypothetical protein
VSHGALIVELIVLFVGVPLAYLYSPWRFPALPVLWVATAYAWWQLTRDPAFDWRLLWNPEPLAHQLIWILPMFAVIAAGLWGWVRWHHRAAEWSLVKHHPRLWMLVMVVYPLLSVYPQGILCRAFFLHRYAVLFPNNWILLLACAMAFGFMHIIFRNPLAVVLTFFGGLLFAWRYQVTGSLLTSNVEHALYGCWLFTVGLGQFFYHGVWPSVPVEGDAAPQPKEEAGIA